MRFHISNGVITPAEHVASPNFGDRPKGVPIDLVVVHSISLPPGDYAHFAMSEATMRRWLSKSGQGFAKTLLNTRLEHGLSLLQTTDDRISEIALDCGFKTPSHFSDAFRKRFGIKPKDIRLAAE